MSIELFTSSDSVRQAGPLKHAQYARFTEPMELRRGGRLEQVRVAYETYGELSPARDNAVLICHALSGDSHVARHDKPDDAGWWDLAVGPGRAIDTDRYFVICPNILGGCRGTTGPNTPNPVTGRPYGPDFPEITVSDIVEVQRRLLDTLGIETLLGVVGGSMGGMQVLQWAISYPERVRLAVPIATAPRLSSQSLAFDVIGRNAISHDPNFRGGHYYDIHAGPVKGLFLPQWPIGGLAIARMIGHITYLSRESMRVKFGNNRNQPREVDGPFEKDTSVASYLAHQGGKFVERFDANSYMTITRAMDWFDLGEGEELRRALAPSRCRWLLISFTSDWLFPPDQTREIVHALLAEESGVSHCNVLSRCGHDAFLLEDELEIYGALIAGALARTYNGGGQAEEPEEDAHGGLAHPDTSIFHGRRLDYDFLERLLTDVRQEAEGETGRTFQRVLDLGCGSGQLLLRLKRSGWKGLLGLERSQKAVLACVGRGIDCIQADLNEGLTQFADKQFDCVLLSRTLQTVFNVDRLVEEMLRVGKRCIVSFPNFAYGPLRRMLRQQGRAPQSEGILRYSWHDTPNIRFLSIADFEDYCRSKGVAIHRAVALNTERREEVGEEPNLNADLAIFVISR